MIGEIIGITLIVIFMLLCIAGVRLILIDKERSK
jgi:hypothetical protein